MSGAWNLVKRVPDISVGSGTAQSGGLAEVLMGRMLASGSQGLVAPVPPQS